MKKKRQKSAKQNRSKNKKHNKKRHQLQHQSNVAKTNQQDDTKQLPLASPPPTSTTITHPLPPGTFISIKKLKPNLITSTTITFNLTKIFFGIDSTFSIRHQSLGDKSKHLHNIYAKVLTLISYLAKSPKAPSSIEPSPQQKLHQHQPKLLSKSNPDLTQTLNLISFNDAQYTQSCANIFLNTSHQSHLKNETTTKTSRARPSYIIERDCHIFGGCVDDDADDEFFISSGAVYQSWPYVFEPGFRSKPLPQQRQPHLSVSDEQIDYSLEQEVDLGTNNNSVSSYELPSYSLENYDINLLHTKHQRKHNSNNNSTFSTYSSSMSDSGESSDDDSDSYRAYKHRHAIGLANFNNNNSQSSLSDLGVMKKAGNLMCLTDSSSCDEVVGRKGACSGQNGRLTTSSNVCGVLGSTNSGKGGRFFSCTNNYQYCSRNNLIF